MPGGSPGLGGRARSLFVRTKPSVWKRGERAAEKVMRRAGCRVVGRNVRLPSGEIDLVCVEKRTGQYVVVEVKARTVDGSDRRPEDAITAAKKRKLLTLAKSLMKDDAVRRAGVRIDVVAVEFEPGRRRPVATRHFSHAVSAG